jgi:leucyl-tRNA synthetase
MDKWLDLWTSRRVFESGDLTGPSPSESDRTSRRYIVSMFPYPSGDLHMGHAEVYAISDAIARYTKLKGSSVLYPIGWDSFGLPAENAAFRRDQHPSEWTYANIAVQAESFRRLGVAFDWRTRLHTSDPEYYRWNQWLFIELYERGLAYRRLAPVNWCPTDQTVLANEQVVQGRCERCGTEVVHRDLTQWFFRITDYAQRLLDDMSRLDWPEDVLRMQRNWIGRSEGAHIDFRIEGRDEPVRVFTTRPDTLYGSTFFVVAADSALAAELVTEDRRAELERYASATRAASEIERLSTDRPKTGVFLGRHAVNPVNGELLPVFASDYVLSHYGTGAVMAVPAHDQRDLDFARAMGLPVRVVIDTGDEDPAVTGVATTGEGSLVNSGAVSGMDSEAAKQAVVDDLAARGLGEATVNYRMRDWLISRQRYWGTPIPMIHCPSCGVAPVPKDQLPVTLPDTGFTLRPSGGQSPLETAAEWLRVECPLCAGPATRDTDTMDTFVDSSWYYLRYPNPSYEDGPFDPAGIERWLPVDVYIGGKEHAILHLLYARFITKALFDMGRVNFVEPFLRLINQGSVIMGGKAMSKSLGNLVSLQEQLALYGPDAVRVTMLFAGPPEENIDWADVSPAGAVKWLSRVRQVAGDVGPAERSTGPGDTETARGVDRLIDEIDQLMDRHRLNVAISRLMELTTLLRRAVDRGVGPADAAVQRGARAMAVMLSCVAPFTAEECWALLGGTGSVVEQEWPAVDPANLVVESQTCVVQVGGKVRARLEVPTTISAEDLESLVLADERVQKVIDGRTLRRVVVRPPAVVNLVL